MSDKKWYVVHTYSGHENKVKTNLEKAIHANGLEEDFGKILVLIRWPWPGKDRAC